MKQELIIAMLAERKAWIQKFYLNEIDGKTVHAILTNIDICLKALTGLSKENFLAWLKPQMDTAKS